MFIKRRSRIYYYKQFLNLTKYKGCEMLDLSFVNKYRACNLKQNKIFDKFDEMQILSVYYILNKNKKIF